MLDIKKIRSEFPILSRKINGHSLVYLDNGATTQSPNVVIDAVSNYYKNHRANVHRGVHTLSEESSNMYDTARKNIAHFLGATKEEIAFVRNTTEACNLVAFSYLQNNAKKGDTVVLNEAEHHSNLLPWVRVANEKGLNIVKLPINRLSGLVDLNELSKIDYTFLAVGHISNFLGCIQPIAEIIELSHKKGAKVFVDGAQSIAHTGINLKNLDVDFFAFSGHKVYAPFGIGVLYIKKEFLNDSKPYLLGGGMINEVSFLKSSYIKGIEMYDAGTPNISGAIALEVSLSFFNSIGKKDIFTHEKKIVSYLYESLSTHRLIEVYGPSNIKHREALVSFNVKGIHGHDIASILDSKGIAVRSGHHCVMPYHKKMSLPGSVRASVGMYNTKEDVDKLLQGIDEAIKVLG